ncbi:MAG: hypothetical protein N3F07_00795 [Candidatus Micrarchaeota archaeon]|nr:hypothetical protein [Candidatus Micrarchaeota archaeon]
MAAQQMKPPEDSRQFFNLVGSNVAENWEEAVSIVRKALECFPNWQSTKAAQFLRKIESGKAKSLKASFGVQQDSGIMIYSVKLETHDGANEVLTLRVGKSLTEISYQKNGSIEEIMRHEKGEVLRWSSKGGV